MQHVFCSGPVNFNSKNASDKIDKAMLDLMQSITQQPKKNSRKASGEQLSKLQLKEEGIAKV